MIALLLFGIAVQMQSTSSAERIHQVCVDHHWLSASTPASAWSNVRVFTDATGQEVLAYSGDYLLPSTKFSHPREIRIDFAGIVHMGQLVMPTDWQSAVRNANELLESGRASNEDMIEVLAKSVAFEFSAGRMQILELKRTLDVTSVRIQGGAPYRGQPLNAYPQDAVSERDVVVNFDLRVNRVTSITLRVPSSLSSGEIRTQLQDHETYVRGPRVPHTYAVAMEWLNRREFFQVPAFPESPPYLGLLRDADVHSALAVPVVYSIMEIAPETFLWEVQAEWSGGMTHGYRGFYPDRASRSSLYDLYDLLLRLPGAQSWNTSCRDAAIAWLISNGDRALGHHEPQQSECEWKGAADSITCRVRNPATNGATIQGSVREVVLRWESGGFESIEYSL